jgi:hypothetical protein
MIPKHPRLDSLDIDNPQIIRRQQRPKNRDNDKQAYDIRVTHPLIPEPRKSVENHNYQDNRIINKYKKAHKSSIHEQAGPAGPDPINVFQIVIIPQATKQIQR